MSSYAYLLLKIPLSFSLHQRRPIPIHPSSPFALSIFVNPSLSYLLYPLSYHPFPLSHPPILSLFYLSSFSPLHTIQPCHSILLLLSLPPLFLSTPIHLHSFSPIPILPSVLHLPISLSPSCRAVSPLTHQSSGESKRVSVFHYPSINTASPP